MGTLHVAGAVILFVSFAYMSYFLFPITDKQPDRRKQRRNALHRWCGIVILVSLIWAGIVGFVLDRSIFWPETIMLLAFGISWLVKGKVGRTVKRLKHKVTG
ncbi:MAG: hypothetical protein JNM91_08555 [Flavobacteriales bacterium]|nr:hypothetical protein [Flavobacteriales bacterium]